MRKFKREKIWLVFGFLVIGTRLDSMIKVLLDFLPVSGISIPEVH